MVELLWKKYQNEIFRKIFINYVIYFVASLIYFTFFLRQQKGGLLTSLIELALRLLVVSNMILFELIEVIQLMGSGWRDYLSDFWNMFDQTSFFANCLTMVLHAADADIRLQKISGAFAIFILYIKLFYWLRLFESTAAFIRMLKEILADISPFLTFLVCCIGMFSNTLLLFQQSREIRGIEAHIFEPIFGVPWVDAFARTYLMGLGDYYMINFGASDGTLVWIIFLLATFITQLLFMNLLIAIMGDTFDRVQEIKHEAATKEKISMIQDFIWILDMEEEFKNTKYILIAEQQMTAQSSSNGWEGKVGQLKTYIQQMSHNEQSIIGSLVGDLTKQLGQVHHSVQTQQSQLGLISDKILQVDVDVQKSKHQSEQELA